MDLQTKTKMAEILNSKDGVNKKLEAILALLTLANLAYGISLKPSALCVHPNNRGSQMCNGFDVHKKGSLILEAGLKPDLLGPNSICIEMSSDEQTRQKQIAANQKMADESSELLPPPSGEERFLSLGNSHWIMFCKAMLAGSKSPSGENLHLPHDLEKLMAEGWKWTVISEKVERSFPSFPSFAQAALNSVNSNNTLTSELEAMLLLANYVKGGLSIQAAMESVAAAQPTCLNYLKDIAHFCQLYSGGSDFPLLFPLRDFCSLAAVLCLLACKAHICQPLVVF